MSHPVADVLIARWAESIANSTLNLGYVQQVSDWTYGALVFARALSVSTIGRSGPADWTYGALVFARAQEKEEEAVALRDFQRLVGKLANALATGEDTSRPLDAIRRLVKSDV